MMEDLTVESSLQDWKELEDEFKTLEVSQDMLYKFFYVL